MREVNVAVWGLGAHAVKNILPALTGSRGVRLYGVCSRKVDVVSSVCSQFACEGWTDAQPMLEDRNVHAVYLSTPIGLHARQGEMVLTANKHLWCEKPLAERADQALSLAALSRERSLTLAEGFMYLYHPQFAAIQNVIRSRRLGIVQSVVCRFGIPPLERPGFRVDPNLGGGAFLDVGTYTISAIIGLFPDMDPEISFAEIVTAPGSNVDTEGRAVLRYANGVSATLEWRINTAYRSEVELWGTEGSVFSERVFSKPADHVPRFRFLNVQGQERYEVAETANHFVRMFTAFRALVDDRNAAEEERVLITRRARLVDRIRSHSRKRDDLMETWKQVMLDDDSMWPSTGKVDLPPAHVDDRGGIQSLVNFPMKNISLISSKKGSVRSNHYHVTDWHYMYVLKGAFDYYWRPTGSGAALSVTRVSAGEMIFTPPMEDHATVFLDDTEMLVASRNPRDQESYESDVRRVVLVDPATVVVP